MSGCYPDLTEYNDDFLAYAFQTQCPAPASTDEARCMQNVYTALRGLSQLNDDNSDPIDPFLVSMFFEPIGTTSAERVTDFCRYITAFEDRAGWEFLDNLMGDPKKCGALYCDFGVRNARVAQRYMTTLATAKPRLEVAKNGFRYR